MAEEKIATVIHGQYGWYYPYTDETGSHGLKIMDNVYEKYYRHGYLTDKHIEAMLQGATVNFVVPSKSGTGRGTNVTAKIIPYTTKAGKDCKIIDFQTDKVDDRKIILLNSEKIAVSYWDVNRFSYTKPQAVLDTLDLENNWRTWSTNEYVGNVKFGSIKVYRSNSRKNDEVYLWCKVENGICTMISEEQYKAAKAQAQAEREAEYKKLMEEEEKVNIVRKETMAWLNSIISQIWPGGSSNSEEIIKNADAVVANVNVPDIESRIIGLLSSSTYRKNISKYVEDTKTAIMHNITRSNYTDPAVPEKIKNDLLQNIKVHVEYRKVKQFRKDLLDEYYQSGLDAMTENVNIDVALSLGYFPTVQKILVKYKHQAPEHIINSMYIDEINLLVLREKILNLLKIYFDFYDMPEKDRKSIAKFIAKNKLTDYYDRISKFDDVLETLIDESRDPKLTKPLLESIAGTPRANVLKDKTFYFEKRGRIRNETLVYKPIELLDRLRQLIKVFNGSSDVAILTNIELDADESFIFQFYTFAGSNSAEGEFDGRRMLNLTRIYNRHYPNEKIGFNFENGPSGDED